MLCGDPEINIYFTLTKYIPVNGKGKKDGDITYGYRLVDDYGSVTVDHYEESSKQSKVLLSMSPQQIVDLIKTKHPAFMSRIYGNGLYINNRLNRVDQKGLIVDEAAMKGKRKKVEVAA